jgi:hypothetical protein
MRRALVLALLPVLAGCAISDAIHAKQDATVRCREQGFIGTVKDAGAFYCWKDKLDDLPVVPPSAPKATVP